MTFKALRSSTLLTTLVTAAILSATPAIAAPGTVATVNGTAIPQSLADALVAEKVSQGAQDSPQLRQAVREELIDRELIVQAAKKAGLEKQADVQTAIRLADQGVLIRAYQITYAQKHVPSDAQLKQLYDQTMANMGKEEFKTRLIVVQSQATKSPANWTRVIVSKMWPNSILLARAPRKTAATSAGTRLRHSRSPWGTQS